MRTPWPTWLRSVWALAALGGLTNCGPSAAASAQQTNSEHRQGLPTEVVAAWRKAGAEFGWIRVEEFARIRFLPESAGRAGDLPAFRLYPLDKNVLAALPVPAVPF